MSLKHANLQKQNSKENLRQNERRHCLRTNGVPVKSDESSDDVLKYVEKVFEEGEMDNPDTVIDQAHRTDREFSDYKTKRKYAAFYQICKVQTQNTGEPARKKIRTNVKEYV